MERVSIDVLYQGMRNKKEKKVSKILEWVIPFIIAAIVAIVLKYFILYKEGRQIWRHEGEIDGNALLQKVQSVL